MKVGIIGCGAYSLALSLMINKNTSDITIWSESQKKIDIINKEHKLESCLKGISLPANLKFTTSLKQAVENKDIIFLVVAVPYVLQTTTAIKNYLNENSIICIASKGIDQKTNKFMDELVLSTINTQHLAVISGPSFAIDMACDNPVALSIASNSQKAITCIKKVLSSNTVELRANSDIIGTEICGSIKNVVAIAAGIINGLGYGESTQTFLITEAIHDLKTLIHHLGGESNTVLSYAGIGDLLLTCTSSKSRNFSFGKLLGSKTSPDIINDYLKNNTVEGYYTLKSIYQLLKNKNIKIDLINVVYDIVFHNENPKILIDFLIAKA